MEFFRKDAENKRKQIMRSNLKNEIKLHLSSVTIKKTLRNIGKSFVYDTMYSRKGNNGT